MTLADELEALAAKADKTDDDIRYYSGGSQDNDEAEELLALVRGNLPSILAALRAMENNDAKS